MRMRLEWLRGWMDPEYFWVRVAAGAGVAALVLLVLCAGLWMERGQYKASLQRLTELNDQQRKTIHRQGQIINQINQGLGQVLTKLDRLEEEQKELPKKLAAQEEREEPTAAAVHTLSADLNSDGIVDWTDFEIFSSYWDNIGPVPADFDRDNQVNWKDFEMFTSQWMKKEAWYRRNG